MQTDKDKHAEGQKVERLEPEVAPEHEHYDDDEPYVGLMRRVRIAITSSLVVIAIVTVCSIIYGLVAHGRLTFEYVIMANAVISAVIIAAGLLFPLAPNRAVDRFRNRQLVEYSMHRDFMHSRAQKQKQGYKIMWVGISAALITGLIEIIIWLVV